MKLYISIFIAFLTFGFDLSFQSISKEIKLEIPKLKLNEVIINHYAYSLSYNEQHEQANWVAYELTKEELKSVCKRSNNFNIDPLVKTGSAENEDYKGSGYDRGHLAPAGDNTWSKIAMEESFYYSNMSPQDKHFNRGIWKNLEELVREWTNENNSLYIVTGPILSNNLKSIGANKVSIPNFFYKVILDYNQPNIKSIGFIIPNKDSKNSLDKFVVSIDSLEKVTGYDFFYQLPDSVENRLEKKSNTKEWNWKIDQKKSATNLDKKTIESVQCLGTTKKGNRCVNKTLNSSGYCKDHLNQKP